MKKLLLILILISGTSIFGQWTAKKPVEIGNKKTYMAKGDSAAQNIYVMNDANSRVPVDISGATINATISDASIKGVATIGNGNITVGTTAAQVSSSSTACRWVEVVNNTSGATVYLGTSTVTTTNGYAALGYKDAIRVPVDNLNKLYLISTAAGTDVRYIYGN